MIKALADADKKDDDDEDEDEGEVEEKEDEADEEEGKYEKFWKAFGKYIKMGLIEDAANRTRLAKLLRYATSKSGDKEISLEEYVANMKEEQKNIYYISGEDKESLLKSPSVEKLLAMDYEIIFMTDSVDEYTARAPPPTPPTPPTPPHPTHPPHAHTHHPSHCGSPTSGGVSPPTTNHHHHHHHHTRRRRGALALGCRRCSTSPSSRASG